jgi:hypothetical protein
VVATGRPMKGSDGFTLCSQSLRRDRFLLASSSFVGVGTHQSAANLPL